MASRASVVPAVPAGFSPKTSILLTALTRVRMDACIHPSMAGAASSSRGGTARCGNAGHARMANWSGGAR
eukprot:3066231-Prorocentrum_lima.AAC.1